MTDKMREAVARAIWNIRREEEDRCDMELEDMGAGHSVWAEADAAIEAMREALVIELPEPYAVVGDYAACGGGRSIWDAEYAEKITDRMCDKTPVYDRASLEAAGVRIKP